MPEPQEREKSFEKMVSDELGAIMEAGRRVEEKVSVLDKRLGEVASSSDGKFKTMEEYIAGKFKEFQAKRSGPVWGGDGVLEVLADADRRHVRMAEILQLGRTERRAMSAPFGKDPVLLAASGKWLALHILKLTKPAQYMGQREYHAKLTQALGGYEKVALQEDVAAEGGDLVPTIVMAEVLRIAQDNSVLRRAGVRVVPMTTKSHAFPARNTAFNLAAIIAEEAAATDTIPASPFTQRLLTAKKLMTFATVSEELLQDNVVALADYLATEFGEQMGRKEDEQGLEGDGVGSNYTGIVAAAGVNAVAALTGGVGTNGGPPRYEQFAQVIAKGGDAVTRENAVWFMHPELFYAGIISGRWSSIAAGDAQGGTLVTLVPNALTGEPAEFLFGRQAFLTSVINKARTKGTLTTGTNAYFGNPSQLIFGDLLDFQIDLNPFSKFSSFQIDIRGVKRLGILVANGPAWVKYTDVDVTKPMV